LSFATMCIALAILGVLVRFYIRGRQSGGTLPVTAPAPALTAPPPALTAPAPTVGGV
jgi:hypothetical protein